MPTGHAGHYQGQHVLTDVSPACPVISLTWNSLEVIAMGELVMGVLMPHPPVVVRRSAETESAISRRHMTLWRRYQTGSCSPLQTAWWSFLHTVRCSAMPSQKLASRSSPAISVNSAMQACRKV